MEFRTFISKDVFKSLSGCILVVEACTESSKMLMLNHFPSIYSLWAAFIFSIIVSFVRFIFEADNTKEGIILSIINAVPIFLGAVGVYQVLLKPIEHLT